jgi:DNA-binding FrmR family transcriptional regulator
MQQMHLSAAVQRDLAVRLSRIEGQVRGVRRMLEQGRDCREVVQQLSAMRAALAKVAATVVAENLEECLRHASGEGGAEEVRAAKRRVLELF